MISYEERIARLSPQRRRLLELRLARQRAGVQAQPDSGAPSTPAVAPLSPLQRRLWFQDRLLPGNPAYHVRVAARISGQLDTGFLTRALTAVHARHAALRVSIRLHSGEPAQVIEAVATPVVRIVQTCEADLRDQVLAEVRAPFRLACGPLWRAALFRLAPDDHVLVVTLHHIVADGWSAAVLYRETTVLYEAWQTDPSADPANLLPPLPVQYPDAARQQHEVLGGGELERQLTYWRQRLADAPDTLHLPTRRRHTSEQPVPHRPTYDGARYRFTLEPELASEVRRVARTFGATVYMVVLAAYSVILAAHSGQRDIVVGSPIANRTRTEYEQLIGFFINTLAMRVDLSGHPTIEQLLRRVRQTCLDAYAHRDAPFDHVVEALGRAGSDLRRPLVRVALGLQRAVPRFSVVGDLRVTRYDVDSGTAQFPLALDIVESDAQLEGAWEYRVDLFDTDDVAALHEDLLEVLTALTAQPQRGVEHLCTRLRERHATRRQRAAARIKHDNRDKLLRRQRSRRDVTGMEGTQMNRTPETTSLTRPGGPSRSPRGEARTRRLVRVSSEQLVTAEPYDSPSAQPLVVSPTVRGVSLAEWVVDNREWFDEQLLKYAGIVFKGFGVGTEEFEAFMLAVSGQLLSDPGRPHLSGPKEQVYVSTDYPAEREIFMHNETWWQYRWAMKIFFSCQVQPEQGGATTMVDCRRVLAGLPSRIVDSFADGLLHVRNFGPRIGLRTWQEAFSTQDRSEVEGFFRDYDIQWEWLDGDRLHTRWVRPVIATHPVTGEQVWFNHAAHAHMSTNTGPEMARAVAELSIYDVPINTYHADGTPISPEDMEAIRDAYRKETIAYPWEPGNVLVLDNMLAAHGREPYSGPRRVLVGLTEPTGWSELP